MSGGTMPKKVKEEYLRKDIEEHRQRTLDKFSSKEYKEAREEQESSNNEVNPNHEKLK